MGGFQGVHGTGRVFCPDMFQSAEADWPVPVNAPQGVDVQSATSLMREFDDDEERAIGFRLTVPRGVSTMHLRLPGRAGDAPARPANIVLRIFARAGERPWSGALALGILNLPNDLPQSFSVSTLLRALGIAPGDEAHFLLTRNPTSESDTLVGRWFLYELGVNFA